MRRVAVELERFGVISMGLAAAPSAENASMRTTSHARRALRPTPSADACTNAIPSPVPYTRMTLRLVLYGGRYWAVLHPTVLTWHCTRCTVFHPSLSGRHSHTHARACTITHMHACAHTIACMRMFCARRVRVRGCEGAQRTSMHAASPAEARRRPRQKEALEEQTNTPMAAAAEAGAVQRRSRVRGSGARRDRVCHSEHHERSDDRLVVLDYIDSARRQPLPRSA